MDWRKPPPGAPPKEFLCPITEELMKVDINDFIFTLQQLLTINFIDCEGSRAGE